MEVEKEIGKIELRGKVAVIDCITLWLTNFFHDNKQDVEKSFAQAQEQLDELVKQQATLVIISNELGMGVHAPSEAGRKFTDLQGWVNQRIAQRADKVILMIAGIPLTIK